MNKQVEFTDEELQSIIFLIDDNQVSPVLDGIRAKAEDALGKPQVFYVYPVFGSGSYASVIGDLLNYEGLTFDEVLESFRPDLKMDMDDKTVQEVLDNILTAYVITKEDYEKVYKHAEDRCRADDESQTVHVMLADYSKRNALATFKRPE